MRYLLINLVQVPEDEADEIRAMLTDAGIHYYETQAGRWKLGVEGIWLPNADQKLHAQQLLDEYQRKRYQSFEAERIRLETLGWWNAFIEQYYKDPLKVIGALLGIVAVLAISIMPFV